jgi:hypothetical protein
MFCFFLLIFKLKNEMTEVTEEMQQLHKRFPNKKIQKGALNLYNMSLGSSDAL